jgi:hypothetical protein
LGFFLVKTKSQKRSTLEFTGGTNRLE